MGQNTAVSGFDFITTGPDAGNVLVARYGEFAGTHGYDLVLVEGSSPYSSASSFTNNASPDNSTEFITGFVNPVDVLKDRSGHFLINDDTSATSGRLYVLTPPALRLLPPQPLSPPRHRRRLRHPLLRPHPHPHRRHTNPYANSHTNTNAHNASRRRWRL